MNYRHRFFDSFSISFLYISVIFLIFIQKKKVLVEPAPPTLHSSKINHWTKQLNIYFIKFCSSVISAGISLDSSSVNTSIFHNLDLSPPNYFGWSNFELLNWSSIFTKANPSSPIVSPMSWWMIITRDSACNKSMQINTIFSSTWQNTTSVRSHYNHRDIKKCDVAI